MRRFAAEEGGLVKGVCLIILLLFLGCRGSPNSETESADCDAGYEDKSQAGRPEDSAKATPKHQWQAAWPDPEAVPALYREFNGFLRTPDAYEKRIRRDAVGYPEGAIFAVALPAYGFANYALAHPESAGECRQNIERLIELASQQWVRHWLESPMQEDPVTLRRWNGHGAFLGHYGLMLACYRLAGGDGRFADRQRQIADVLRQGFRANPSGAWVSSYPQRAWLFDSQPALLAVRLSDVQNAGDLDDSARLLRDHLKYRQTIALDKASGFPASEIDCRTGKPRVGPRGCDLSGTLCFLGHLAPDHCRDLYARYKKTFWIEKGAGDLKLCGFREWPLGTAGTMDIDSGPILFDIGAAASGFGLGATRFAADAAAHRALLATLDQMRLTADTAQPLLQAFIEGLVVSKDYHYRHLMADAVAFYCLTWRPWCDPP
jgi:hypothetical protein